MNHVAHSTVSDCNKTDPSVSLAIMIFCVLAMYSGTCGSYVVGVLSPQTTISYLTTRRYGILRLLGAAIINL